MCDCAWKQKVEGHPCNTVDWDNPGSRQGYSVCRCIQCGRIWGIRWQWDGGTGDDNDLHDFGIGDPFALVTERHY